MSDSDDIPDLVSSEEESSDSEQSKRTEVDYAKRWLKKGETFLKKQELWMRVFSLGPFLYGCNNIINPSWTKALNSAQLLLNNKRSSELTYLEWKEWECLDLVDHVVTKVQLSMRDPKCLAKSLSFVTKLDACKSGVVIDVDWVIEEGEKINVITAIWRDVLKSELSKNRQKAAKFAVLYVVRIYREHVIHYFDNPMDFIDFTKKRIRKNVTHAEEKKKIGNAHFKNEMFYEALKSYTQAAEADLFHHVYYGNRAQAYISVRKYMEALADGRRAITIKPDFAKGHYRYALAFHGLGQLERAIIVNKVGQELCKKSNVQDYQNVKELENQGQSYIEERISRSKSHKLTDLPKELDEKLASFGGPLKDKTNGNVQHTSDGDSDTSSSADHQKLKSKKKNKNKSSSGSSKNQKSDDKNKSRDSSQTKLSQQLQSERIDFQTFCAQASEAYLAQIYKKSMTNFQSALDVINMHDKPEEVFNIDEVDILTLKYAFSVAAIGTNSYKSIMDGIDKLEEIKDYIEKNDHIKFPVVYYGLGKAYVSLNRFSDAIEPLQNGYQIASSVSYTKLSWPGINQLIKETDPKVLQENLKEMLQLCRFPPTPDAVCRNHTDTSDSRNVIYLSDPDFKGYVKMICQMDCVITLHQTCFKMHKSLLNKQGDKEMLDTMCPTPDCIGAIVKLIIVRGDSLTKTYESERFFNFKEKDKKPVEKQRTTNETKIAKKQEKKEKRKQRKKETTPNYSKEDDAADVITDGASAMAFIADMENEDSQTNLPDIKDTTILNNKKDITTEAQKPSKSKRSKKKNKDKGKQILNLEVNFSDRKEETLLNENSVLSDEEKENRKSEASFSVPSDLKSEISKFEKSFAASAKHATMKPDEITENLFSYFVEILKANGPLAISDARVQQELEVFPPEAIEKIKQVGGLGDFLKQSLKFAVIDDIISLMSDAKHAREIALIRRQELNNSVVEPSEHNAWKTVGKTVNNVDGLSESVTISTGDGFPMVTISSSISVTSVSSFSSVSTVVTCSVTSVSLSCPTPSETIGNISSYYSSQQKKLPPPPLPPPHWSEGVNAYPPPGGQILGVKPPEKLTMNTLDSIDDYPMDEIPVPDRGSKKSLLDDIDDFDRISDSSSEVREHSEHSGYSKSSSRVDLKITGDSGNRDSSSRSSTKSDVSDLSSKNDMADLMPKPLKPLSTIGGGSGALFGHIGSRGKNSPRWDKLETDFESTWNQVSKEEYPGEQVSNAESVSKEVQRVGEEFVRKSDETFVSELAESVVDKLYEGKTVTAEERQGTLNKVSADIWKDFERSAQAGKKGSTSLWADTPAGSEYSNNMGQFATDFMKRHYKKMEQPASVSVSPSVSFSSSVGDILPQKPLVSETFSSLPNNSGFNTSLASPWPNEQTGDMLSPGLGQPSSTSSPFGYSLFSGPSLGFDSFNSNSSYLSQPVRFPQSSPMPSPFVRPPGSVSSYYQTAPPPNVPFRPPGAPRMPIPPPVGMPFPPQSSASVTSVEKCDSDTQTSVQLSEAGTMTEAYEPYKKEYLQLISDTKTLHEKWTLEIATKDQKIMALESDLKKSAGLLEMEKKEWETKVMSHRDEIRQFQELFASKERNEKELYEKFNRQERQLSELSKLAKDQREKDVSEVKRQMDSADTLRGLHDKQLQRAISAETEILRYRLKSAQSILERSKKEAIFHKQGMTNYKQKLEDEKKPVPPPVLQALDFWNSVAIKSEENSHKIQEDYDRQIEKIKVGTFLNELEPIVVPSPPAVPEAIRNMPFMQPGFMMHRMPMQNRPPFNPQGLPQVKTSVGGNMPLSLANIADSVQRNTPPPGVMGPGPAGAVPQSMYNPTSYPSVSPVPQVAYGGTMQAPLRPRAPLTVPSRAPLRSIGGVQMSSYEKLLLQLKIKFPDKSRDEVIELITKLRMNNGGSLSGLKFEEILQKMNELVLAASQGNKQDINTGNAGGPPPGLSSSWAFAVSDKTRGGSNSELFKEEEEDPCVICHEEMEDNSVVRLECGHIFHDQCIRKWFQEQSTCPNCRVHTLLSDDFPSLG